MVVDLVGGLVGEVIGLFKDNDPKKNENVIIAKLNQITAITIQQEETHQIQLKEMGKTTRTIIDFFRDVYVDGSTYSQVQVSVVAVTGILSILFLIYTFLTGNVDVEKVKMLFQGGGIAAVGTALYRANTKK